MSKAYIRVWQELEVTQLGKHLLIVGELTGDCANCRQIGIDYRKEKNCPKCKTEFRYIAIRQGTSGSYGHLVRRTRTRRPDLVFVDFSDYKQASQRLKARQLFSTDN